MHPLSPGALVRRRYHVPYARIPAGAALELPGRGTTYVTDTPGPSPDSPTVLLLHAVGCTGLLTWFPSIEPLTRRYRVVTLDQRWHGRGIASPEFSLHDCADDVAALIDALDLRDVMVAGFSMGSIIAQRVWRQHPDKIDGLVLCATTDRFRSTIPERVFHQSLEIAMAGARGVARSRTAVRASRQAARALELFPEDMHDWVLGEFRSTSPWAVGQAVAALGRHHSRPWLGRIDVPTAVVVTLRDKVLPPDNQIALARRIPGATIHDIDAGHASCVLESERFVPALLEAVDTVNARRGDLPRRAERFSGSRRASGSA
ncbi:MULTISPECIES: alpha/beta fold hydrolase [unclassified Nocardioides]|uniref:alpha/beta fold hydrolase n=1 Tax=unclassified Nocardioides TaxID=2615069 RepID=UPI0000570E23|nr:MULTISPECIES: alpha/beta fold hydrolase [unclassified Nocardioides]ABL82293.1 alpha/beta hydrolase fold protein [Nocardioides sp. JS614]